MAFYLVKVARRLARPAIVAGLFILLLLPTPAQAQSGEDEDAVIAAVQQLFDAIATRDTLAARAVLMPEGLFFAIRDTDDGPSTGSSSHSDFIKQLTMPGDDWLERMWNPTILIHGRMAVVWTKYDFYRNGAFSHCGVDAFNLLKTADGWKIAATTYTAEPEGCEESPLGPPR